MMIQRITLYAQNVITHGKNVQNSSEKVACTECPETRIPSNPLVGNYECVCQFSNFFDDGYSLKCRQCDLTCNTCNGPLSSNCLTCDNSYRQLEFSTFSCPDYYYDIEQLQCASIFAKKYQKDVTFLFKNVSIILKMVEWFVLIFILEYQKVKYVNVLMDIMKNQINHNFRNALRNAKLVKLQRTDVQLVHLILFVFYIQQRVVSVLQNYMIKKTKSPVKNVTLNANYGEDQCLSCDSITNRELKLNQCQCKPHYFEIQVQECQICSAFCYECQNNFDNCTSCNDDRYLDGSTCKCTAKIFGAAIGTFDFNGQVKCQKCNYSCGSCDGSDATDCFTCIENENRYQVGNTCVCKDGYFNSGLPVCEKCGYKCKNCKQKADNCISCKDNTFRIFISGSNKCSCIQRYYDDGKNELCSIESNRTFNEQLFTCDCNIGYYDSGIEICQKCHYSCLNCSSGDYNSCIQCVDSKTSNRAFHNNTCQCLLGYYDDGKLIQCQKCDMQCLNCIDQSYQCLSCPQTRNILSNCKCAEGYYSFKAMNNIDFQLLLIFINKNRSSFSFKVIS
ncbi:unnamed protein product [Paramecium sonneborni]|uniref:EGF-like domain-containing protein n=1 Tax=Paramecium sonneborni TaxID=65129 RepID=A0A8S1RRJ3_9CILI|nr:unnamed protein product [Paramecium sonneborni]